MKLYHINYSLQNCLTVNSCPNCFSVEDYNYMNSIETMNSLKSSGTIESTELNIDTYSFAAKIINFHRIKTHTNNAVYNEKACLDGIDKVLSNLANQYDKYDSHNDDLNYDILDLDNLEYITYKHKRNTNNNFDGSSDLKHFLYEHSYCMREQGTLTLEETLDSSKFTDCYKTEEKSFIDIFYFNGINYKVTELDEYPQFCDTECNLQEQIVESVNFEMIPNYVSTDNISIYTISDAKEMNNDFKASDLDVISISSASSVEDRFNVINENDLNSCGYHSSDFEFIEEHEAKRNGLIINYNPQKIKDKVKTIEIAKEYNSRELILDYFNVPTVNKNVEYKIPQDTNYISMFERNIPYALNCMDNKSIYTNNCSMNAEYQGLGFNISLYDHEEVAKHVQEEANESEKKIIFMYPSENPRMRKRRRI